MNQEKQLSIIIPAYKEAENLRIILPRINKVINKMGITSEVLVIDTFKKEDDTETVCKNNLVSYFNRETSNSYGDAVRTGIKNACGRYILFMDADGSHDPEFIKPMYDEISIRNYDVVVASRYITGGISENQFILRLMSIVLNLFYSVLLNLNCKDVSNSFKIYKADELKVINLKCKNFDIIEELLFLLKKGNKRLVIKEIPFHFKKRIFGKTKRNFVLFVLSYVKTIIRLRLKK